MYCHVLQQNGYHKYTKYHGAFFYLNGRAKPAKQNRIKRGCQLQRPDQLQFRLLRGSVLRTASCVGALRIRQPFDFYGDTMVETQALCLNKYHVSTGTGNTGIAFQEVLETQALRFNIHNS